MRITIFAAGSRGDIQPCAVLGRRLQQSGFNVRIVAPENFAGLITSFGIEFFPLRGDIQKIMGSDTGRRFMQGGSTNLLRSIRMMRSMIDPIVRQMFNDTLEACRGADILISLGIFAPFAQSIAELVKIPVIFLEPTPLLPTREFVAPGWPSQTSLGGTYNYLTGQIMLRVIWQWYRPYVDKFRQDHGLTQLNGESFFRILNTTPLLGGYSSSIIPRPTDWPETACITGYWLPEEVPEWEPSIELRRFLEAGDPPVYAGFGSMGGKNPETLAQIVLDALEKTNSRGVLATGWGGITPAVRSNKVIVLDSAPHQWLFPKMKIIVHHGGAGTTAEGLRAGIPTVIVPFILDQPFWGKRVERLKVGPKPIMYKQLSSERLAEAIQQAGQEPNFRRRAAELGERMRNENGIDAAVDIIRKRLGA